MSEVTIDDVREQFADNDQDALTDEAIQDKIDEFNGFKLPADEVIRGVVSGLEDKFGIEQDDSAPSPSAGNEGNGSSSDEVEIDRIAEITEDDEWHDIEGVVLQLWDANSDSIAQTGLIGDESGVIKFSTWAKSADSVPELETGEVYEIQNVAADYYEPADRFSVKLNKYTEVSHQPDTNIDVNDTTVQSGIVTRVQEGLIKRCPREDCSHKVRNGRCNEHGEVNGEFELRLKAILSLNGDEAVELLFNDEQTAELIGLSLDEAVEMASDAFDIGAVEDYAKDQVVGRYLEVETSSLGDYELVESWMSIESVDASAVAETRERLSA
jgi:ssDNA-binding replication factor A large subunit